MNHLGKDENIDDGETGGEERKRRTWPEDRRLPIEHITRLDRTGTDVGRWFALQILQFFRNSLERHFECCAEMRWNEFDLKETYRLNFIRTEPREMKKTDSREKPRERQKKWTATNQWVRERERNTVNNWLVFYFNCLSFLYVDGRKMFTWRIFGSTAAPSKQRRNEDCFHFAFAPWRIDLPRYIFLYLFCRFERYQVRADPVKKRRRTNANERKNFLFFLHRDWDHKEVNKSRVKLSKLSTPVTIENAEYPDKLRHSS